jgi:hypothetical protein
MNRYLIGQEEPCAIKSLWLFCMIGSSFISGDPISGKPLAGDIDRIGQQIQEGLFFCRLPDPYSSVGVFNLVYSQEVIVVPITFKT